jgi:hypothetical protein
MRAPHPGVWILLALGLGPPADRSAEAAEMRPGTAAVETADIEYPVKAAYIHAFIGYATWPKGTFEKEDSPIRLLVVGKDPFGKILEETFEGKRIGKRSVTIARAKTLPKQVHAEVVFCGELPEKERQRAIAELGKLPILLIGETPGFAEAGAAINLYLHADRVRFEINTDAVKLSGMTLSSQLLKLAKIVKTKKKEGEQQ